VYKRAIPIEKDGESEPEDVHVDGKKHRDNEEGRRANEHVHVFVGNHSKRGWVEKHMVGLMKAPHRKEFVAKVVVTPLEEVAAEPYRKKGDDVVSIAVLGIAKCLGLKPSWTLADG
jgi:hypothetical protein